NRPYVAFQDSDDEWHPEKLEWQMRALEANPDASIVYSDMHRIGTDGSIRYYRSPTIVRGRLIDPKTRFWQTYMLAMQPVLMKRSCLNGTLFDERLIMF